MIVASVFIAAIAAVAFTQFANAQANATRGATGYPAQGGYGYYGQQGYSSYGGAQYGGSYRYGYGMGMGMCGRYR